MDVCSMTGEYTRLEQTAKMRCPWEKGCQVALCGPSFLARKVASPAKRRRQAT